MYVFLPSFYRSFSLLDDVDSSSLRMRDVRSCSKLSFSFFTLMIFSWVNVSKFVSSLIRPRSRQQDQYTGKTIFSFSLFLFFFSSVREFLSSQIIFFSSSMEIFNLCSFRFVLLNFSPTLAYRSLIRDLFDNEREKKCKHHSSVSMYLEARSSGIEMKRIESIVFRKIDAIQSNRNVHIVHFNRFNYKEKLEESVSLIISTADLSVDHVEYSWTWTNSSSGHCWKSFSFQILH